LRSEPDDVHAWIGLGEAYAKSGRHSAALKSFARAEILSPGNWYAKYILGNVQKDISDYAKASDTFRTILADHPNEFSVSLSLAQTLSTWAYASFRTGEFSKSVSIALEGVKVAGGLVEEKEELSEAWKLIGDASFLGSLVEGEPSRELAQLACSILGLQGLEINGPQTEVDGDADVNGSPEKELRDVLLQCNIAAMEKTVALTEGDRLAHSAAYFNLGLARYRSNTQQSLESTPDSVLPALECFKKAIQSEPRNFEYWTALGVAAARHFPSVAEKAFSRSLQINERVMLAKACLTFRMHRLGLISESCT
jgi:superkiller protein 3